MQPTKGTRRVAAYAIDSVAIGLYCGLLFSLTIAVDPRPVGNPWIAQFLSFVTLTFPVGLYFALSEASARQGTLGKRLLGIRVVGPTGARISLHRSALRTLVKLLPWEVAHMGVHHLIVHGRQVPPTPVPLWLWIVLLVPTAIALGYVASLFGPGGRTPYDRVAGTRVLGSRTARGGTERGGRVPFDPPT